MEIRELEAFVAVAPYGHRWALAQHVRDVPDHEITEAAARMFGAHVA